MGIVALLSVFCSMSIKSMYVLAELIFLRAMYYSSRFLFITLSVFNHCVVIGLHCGRGKQSIECPFAENIYLIVCYEAK